MTGDMWYGIIHIAHLILDNKVKNYMIINLPLFYIAQSNFLVSYWFHTIRTAGG